MASIEDRWYRPGPDGKRVPSARHERPGRWRARYTDTSGRARAKSFERKIDAEQFLIMREKARVRTELLASDGDGIDPAGYYVYLLWGAQGDDAPLYAGRSGNILARLGDHLGDSAKRSEIGWVSLIRCTSEKAMIRRETSLIHRYRPPWNRHIPPEEAGHEIAA